MGKTITKAIKPGTITLEKSLAKAIKLIKTCPYKGTHIKVELEGHLVRDFPNGNFGNNSYCATFIKDHVSQEALDALVFCKFYFDGSVDSEFTFTLPIDKVTLVVEFIKAFKELALAVGNGLNTTGAGMHIAILSNTAGKYPLTRRSITSPYQENFVHTMNRLLPALYFLGSANAISRNLRFRHPQVDLHSKHNAITGHKGVFEYRVFETCYDKPEAFLDFVCVIAKTLQFYSGKLVEFPFFGTIGELAMPDNAYHLGRFYFTLDHIKALDLGLAILKPDHKTIEQLKKERNFGVNLQEMTVKEQAEMNRWKAEHVAQKEVFEKKKQEIGDAICKRIAEEESLGYVSFNLEERQIAIDTLIESQTQAQGVSITEDEFIKQKKTLKQAGLGYALVTV